MLDTNMSIKRKEHLNNLVGQTAGLIFGLVFVFSEHYEGIDLFLAIVGAPITFAGLIRFIMGTHRIAKKFAGKRLYNEQGECIGCISNPLLLIVIDVISVMLLVNTLVWCGQKSPVFSYVALIALLLLEAFVLIRDIQYFTKSRSPM